MNTTRRYDACTRKLKEQNKIEFSRGTKYIYTHNYEQKL
jgi:hypothetical protein